jgi:pilus assembly protein Flp/PilA
MKQTVARLRFDVNRFFGNEIGASSIEYALIAVCISIAIVAAATAIGTSLDGVFDAVAQGFATALAGD